MSDFAPSPFVRQDLVPERAAPIKTTGFVGFLRTRLFNSPTNILITIVSVLLLWFVVVPALKGFPAGGPTPLPWKSGGTGKISVHFVRGVAPDSEESPDGGTTAPER